MGKTVRNDIWGWATRAHELGYSFNMNRPDPYDNGTYTAWEQQEDGSYKTVFYVKGCPQEWGSDVWNEISGIFHESQ